MQADTQYKNPTPVAVAIIPVETELKYNIGEIECTVKVMQVVYARRNIEPKMGMLALPGGFVNELERLETGGKREVKEETGLIITEDEFQLFRSEITPNNRNLIFGITPVRSVEVLKELEENWKNDEKIREETQGFVIGALNISDAAFPLHQKALGKYLDKVNGDMINNMVKIMSPEGVEQLVINMKKDGYLTEDYEYQTKLKVKNKM